MHPEQSNHEAQIIDFPIQRLGEGLSQTERINGLKINLGRMTLGELRLLEANCEQRLDDARMDVYIVRDHIESRLAGESPDGPEAA